LSQTFPLIVALIERQEVRISEHGYDELSADGILVQEAVAGVREGLVVEDYPGYPKGPCVLVLQRDSEGRPLHVLWGIPRKASSPAVLVTAYRPDPNRWSKDYLQRKS
jgi:hypothetical protein